MTDKRTCKWQIGTVYSGSKLCGKPAKKQIAARHAFDGKPTPVCGIHARSAVLQGCTFDPEPED